MKFALVRSLGRMPDYRFQGIEVLGLGSALRPLGIKIGVPALATRHEWRTPAVPIVVVSMADHEFINFFAVPDSGDTSYFQSSSLETGLGDIKPVP
jgi:hypothetical protein